MTTRSFSADPNTAGNVVVTITSAHYVGSYTNSIEGAVADVQAMRAGASAKANGADVESNPYDHDKPWLHNTWKAGWLHGVPELAATDDAGRVVLARLHVPAQGAATPHVGPPLLPGEIWRGEVNLSPDRTPARLTLCAVALPDVETPDSSYLTFSTAWPTVAHWTVPAVGPGDWVTVDDHEAGFVYAAALRALRDATPATSKGPLTASLLKRHP